jgi:AraC-like DNA-binding protein
LIVAIGMDEYRAPVKVGQPNGSLYRKKRLVPSESSTPPSRRPRSLQLRFKACFRGWKDLNIPAIVPLRPGFRISQNEVRLSSREPVRIQEVAPQHDFPPHDHEFAELCLVWSGKGWHRTAEGLRPLRAGSMIVMMPGQVHAFEGNRRLIVSNIYYLSEWLLGDLRAFSDGGAVLPLFLFQSIFQRPAWKEIPLFQLDREELAMTRRDLDDLREELDRPSPAAFYLRATFLRFFYRCARAFVRSGAHPPWAVPAEVRRLLDGIEGVLGERRPFSLAKAAREAGLSPRHAARLFRAHVGTSLGRHYQRRRVLVACNLLVDPARTVTGVAHELGFADGPHFTRCFRTEKGITPSRYREIYIPF